MALPPYCDFCNKDIREKGLHYWISFKKSDLTDNIESQNENRPSGWCGPTYTDRGGYFCKNHKSIKKYSHLTMADALEKYDPNQNLLSKLKNIFRRKSYYQFIINNCPLY